MHKCKQRWCFKGGCPRNGSPNGYGVVDSVLGNNAGHCVSLPMFGSTFGMSPSITQTLWKLLRDVPLEVILTTTGASFSLFTQTPPNLRFTRQRCSSENNDSESTFTSCGSQVSPGNLSFSSDIFGLCSWLCLTVHINPLDMTECTFFVCENRTLCPKKEPLCILSESAEFWKGLNFRWFSLFRSDKCAGFLYFDGMNCWQTLTWLYKDLSASATRDWALCTAIHGGSALRWNAGIKLRALPLVEPWAFGLKHRFDCNPPNSCSEVVYSSGAKIHAQHGHWILRCL